VTGHGWGHGVGMSQWGAYGYALHGWKYGRILAHYYPGTRVSTTGNGDSISTEPTTHAISSTDTALTTEPCTREQGHPFLFASQRHGKCRRIPTAELD